MVKAEVSALDVDNSLLVSKSSYIADTHSAIEGHANLQLFCYIIYVEKKKLIMIKGNYYECKIPESRLMKD